MKDWEMVRLGDVCEIISGSTPKTNINEFWGGEIKWVTPAEISETDCYINDTERHLTQAGLDSTALRLLPIGTVLLSSRAPIGKVAITGAEMACNQGFKNLICSNKIHNVYLYYFLKKNKRRLENLGRGATFKEITKGIVADIQIPLPPLSEQRRIAGILDEADAIRKARAESLRLLDELVKSTFIDMFGDPVTNPKGWVFLPFEQLCESRLGKMLDKKQQTGEHVKPYLRNANVQWHHFDLTDVFEMDFNEQDQIEFLLREGDVLICEGGEVGKCAIWHGELPECYFQKALHRVRPYLNKANSAYIAHLMEILAIRGALSPHSTSATIAHITGVKLKAMRIPAPPFALQQEFASFVMAVDRQRATQRSTLAESEQLFASLSQRAFRGEL